MSTLITTVTANGSTTVTTDPHLIGGAVLITVKGAIGGITGGVGGVVTGALIIAASTPLTAYIGYHLGGHGLGPTSGPSGDGGRSAAILISGVLEAEAGGGGGGSIDSGTGIHYGGGNSGPIPGSGSDAYGGTTVGTGASGSTPGTSPSGGAANGSFAGAAGSTNGGNAAGNGGGGGGGYAGGGAGSGGGSGGGAGSCYYNPATVAYPQVLGGYSGNTDAAIIVISQTVADAPNAPTLLKPANGLHVNTTTVSTEFSWTPNPAVNSGTYNGYALRAKVAGAGSYQYWNGTALQGTIIYNADTSADIIIGTGIFTAGSTYNWAVSTQEAYYNLQGAFSGDQTFVASLGPVAVITAPTGTISNSQPTIIWTGTYDSTDVQTFFRAIVYTVAQTQIMGFAPGTSPSTWDSGTVAGAGLSVQVGTPLSNLGSYVAYVQLTETGATSGPWATSSFAVQYDTPAVPTLTVQTLVDGITKCPYNQCIVTAADNLLSRDDASFEATVGTAVASGGTSPLRAVSSTYALDGTSSLRVTRGTGSTGATTLTIGPYNCSTGQTYSAMVSSRAATIARSSTLAIQWLNAASGVISTTTGAVANDTTVGWTKFTVSGAAPALAVKFNLIFTWNSAAASEVHYLDCFGAYLGVVTAWTRGGMIGASWVKVQYSDDGGATWLTVRNASNIALPVSTQQIQVNDYEAISNQQRLYQAVVMGIA